MLCCVVLCSILLCCVVSCCDVFYSVVLMLCCVGVVFCCIVKAKCFNEVSTAFVKSVRTVIHKILLHKIIWICICENLKKVWLIT